MKIRSGFVSNSSSSSFIAAGFPASEIEITVDPRKFIEENCNLKQIDGWASAYFSDDISYQLYREGKSNADFWQWCYKQNTGKSVKAPEGFYEMDYAGNPYYYKQVGNSVEYGSVEVDPNLIVETMEEIMAQFPDASVKVFVRHAE